MAHLSFLVICLIWGSSFILMKRATIGISPVEIAMWRVLTGGLALGLLSVLLRRPWTVQRRDLLPLLGIVLLGFVWPYTLQPALIPRIGSAFVGMMVGFTPLLTILVSIPLLGIWPTARQMVGVLGALVCLGLLAQEGLRREVSWEDLLLTISVPFAYAVANSWIRRSLGRLPSMELTLLCLLLSTLFLFPAACLTEDPAPWSSAIYWEAWGAAAILGVLGTGLSTYLFTQLVQTKGPLFAGMVTNVVPIGAVLWGVVDGETVTSQQVLALLGLISMVAIVQFPASWPRKPA